MSDSAESAYISKRVSSAFAYLTPMLTCTNVTAWQEGLRKHAGSSGGFGFDSVMRDKEVRPNCSIRALLTPRRHVCRLLPFTAT